MAMTAETYGHLLPDLENDAAKMEAGALALLLPCTQKGRGRVDSREP
jgi:hypothetical protein